MDIFERLSQNPAFQAFHERKDDLGNLSLQEEALMIVASYLKAKKKILIVKHNLYTAQRLYERIKPLLQDEALLFAVESSMRVEAIAESPERMADESETLYELLTRKQYVCITHVAAYTRFLPNPQFYRQNIFHLHVDDEVNYDELIQALYLAGYARSSRVDQPLVYAYRGGIIDVFSVNYEYPLRIEFFDNVIESIRFFDTQTKRTIQTIDEAEIIPASDILFTEKEKATIVQTLENKKEHASETLREYIDGEIEKIQANEHERSLMRYYAVVECNYSLKDYLGQGDVILSTIEEIKDAYHKQIQENVAYIQELVQLERSISLYTTCLDIETLLKGTMQIHTFENIQHPLRSEVYAMHESEEPLYQMLRQFKDDHEYCVFLCVNDKESKQVQSILEDFEIAYDYIETLEKGIHFSKLPFNFGFIAEKEKIKVYSSQELFHVVHQQAAYTNKFKSAHAIHDIQELHPGDYVVHQKYGIGQYIGIVTKENEGIHKDYLHVVYKGGDSLFVPLEQFQLIRKFVSKEGVTPRLNKLGGKEWEKTKAKVQESVNDLAERLVKLYALREEHIGFAFSPDTPFQKEFEDDFAYPLTLDQEIAIQEIKADMEKDTPMDRLLCGDVGFGKTEVAFRAAFKAMMDGKQVAFLCPTTILSNQHYNVAKERFKQVGANIEVVNRFVVPTEMNRIKAEVKTGKTNLLIGTHRLLSKDIQFHDLGLLIIDEEQRFGVEHKEKIKELKNSIDVLSLSATPIPRTLQMSLVGIRSLSQLNTPPQDRMSVQTYIVEKNDELIREVIERELARNGQVFYLYNRVDDIYSVAQKLRRMLPGVSIGVAHGKMNREEIEAVMMNFIANEYQVLLCTTIIETGIDIPNANTILVENAHRFGLSQLYQIKGRVGRSNRLAYAYLMVPPNQVLNEAASKRLKSMKDFTRLGSGYQIAMRDLTIRGAGDMLGSKQAGFMDTVGMDMYIEMLNNAIREVKGESKIEEKPVQKVEMAIDAYIPQKFESDDYEKLSLYQRLQKIHTKQELKEMENEIIDNYGKLPESVQLLFVKKLAEILLNEDYVEKFTEKAHSIVVSFTKAWSEAIDGEKMFIGVSAISTKIMIKYLKGQILVELPKRTASDLHHIVEFMELCENL